jgi:hypothetical protein
VLEETASHPSF